jgi:A/G-specific adenine glycosylase
MQRRAAGGDNNRPVSIAGTMLAWYDRERRHLPWRAEPGEDTEPYRVWLSEIMLQQTTVKAVLPRYELFLRRWPDVEALALAELGEVLAAWAGLGYYARARNLHACAREVVARHGGQFPATEAGLRALPGIGNYTAAAIVAIAFGERAPVDGTSKGDCAAVRGRHLCPTPRLRSALWHVARCQRRAPATSPRR